MGMLFDSLKIFYLTSPFESGFIICLNLVVFLMLIRAIYNRFFNKKINHRKFIDSGLFIKMFFVFITFQGLLIVFVPQAKNYRVLNDAHHISVEEFVSLEKQNKLKQVEELYGLSSGNSIKE